MTGKQLKNSILQWAIQGKLVPQDPNDEPASVLLERIRAEKAQLIKESKIKKDKNESIIYRGDDNSYYEKIVATGEVKCIDEEVPFEIPQGWEWCRLGEIGITETGITPSKTHPEYFGNYIPFIGPANILEDKIVNETQGLSEEGIKYGRVIRANSILQVCIGGSIGKCAIVRKDVTFNQQINSITPLKCCLEYVHFVLQSETFRLAIMSKATGTATPIINRGNWEKLLFPLPPYNEQNRIIAKLVELIPQVEKYNEVQNSLDELNVAINGKLKKSILQEAIQGKLVPQIASEGTAQELLEQIKAAKQKLVKEGKLKKSALASSVIFRGDDNKYYEQVGDVINDISEEIAFDIPENWRWCRLKDLCRIITGATFKKEESSQNEKGIRVLRGGNILPFWVICKSDDLFLDKSRVKPEIILRKNDLITPAVTSLENICKMARISEDMESTTVGGFVFILRPYSSNSIFSIYLLEALCSPTLVEHIKSITNKSGQAFYNIGKERLATVLIPLPPIAEQQKINTIIEELFQKLR